MALLATLSKPRKKNREHEPFISIMVPAYNEAKVIRSRIENLLELDYPDDKYEVLIVESGSTDATYEIAKSVIEQKANSKPAIKLIREGERRGKASAINLGAEQAKGDIVLVTDANSIFDRSVLRKIAPHFADPKVGGVGGRYLVANPDNPLGSSEAFYWDLEYLMRYGEALVDSACTFHGEINAWRKDLVRADVNMLTEDLDMAVSIRRKGYKIAYEPEAEVYEPAATTAADQIKQRKRTSIGTIQCMFKHLGYFLPPRDLYSLLIFPSHKILPMLCPFLLLLIPILYLLIRDLRVILLHLGITILVFLALYALLLFLKSRLIRNADTSSKASATSILKILYYVLLNQYLILLAWKDILCGRYSVLWEKAETARLESSP